MAQGGGLLLKLIWVGRAIKRKKIFSNEHFEIFSSKNRKELKNFLFF